MKIAWQLVPILENFFVLNNFLINLFKGNLGNFYFFKSDKAVSDVSLNIWVFSNEAKQFKTKGVLI